MLHPDLRRHRLRRRLLGVRCSAAGARGWQERLPGQPAGRPAVGKRPGLCAARRRVRTPAVAAVGRCPQEPECRRGHRDRRGARRGDRNRLHLRAGHPHPLLQHPCRRRNAGRSPGVRSRRHQVWVQAPVCPAVDRRNGDRRSPRPPARSTSPQNTRAAHPLRLLPEVGLVGHRDRTAVDGKRHRPRTPAQPLAPAAAPDRLLPGHRHASPPAVHPRPPGPVRRPSRPDGRRRHEPLQPHRLSRIRPR